MKRIPERVNRWPDSALRVPHSAFPPWVGKSPKGNGDPETRNAELGARNGNYPIGNYWEYGAGYSALDGPLREFPVCTDEGDSNASETIARFRVPRSALRVSPILWEI